MFLIQDLPEEIKAGPRAYRTAVWTVAFRQFFDIQLIFPMILVLLVGPDLISQDLRFNAIPLYLSRPVRRLEYFLGKLGVIATFLASVTVVPVFVGFVLGIGFSLDPSVIRDTARVLAAIAGLRPADRGGLGRAVDAGLLLAVEEFPIRGRDVAGLLVGQLGHGGRAGEHRGTPEWCPLASYTNNINRIRDALLDAGPAWDRLANLGEMGRREVRSPMGMGPFGPGRRTRAGEDSSTRSGPEASASVPRRRSRSSWAPADYPWQWSAGVLAGLAAASVLVLATRVRGLDRLR